MLPDFIDDQHPYLFMSLYLGLALGGQAGARLADKLVMTASASTLLHLLHQMETPEVGEPQVIGIDDWALCKGRDYGTLIIDHETGKPIDVLPERDSETVKQWLEQHPTIEIVTRDRNGEYRDAISQALPEAVHIADRWHLLKNLREMVERHISSQYARVRQLVANSTEGEVEPDEIDTGAKNRRYAPGPTREALRTARTEKREALFAAVKERHEQGVYTTEIAGEFNLSRKTISRWVNCQTLPPDARGRFKRKCLIDDHVPYLRQRIEAGCTNQSLLWREIVEQGFTGSSTLVGKWIREHYEAEGEPINISNLAPKKSPVVIPTPRELSWLFVRHSDQLEAEQQQLLTVLLQDAKLAELRQLALTFIRIVSDGLSEQWNSWLETCCASAITELKNFAIGLKKDIDAVYEAIRQPWSNGPTEGHVNKLKLLKRQMYGRASFKLLRIRVLLAD